MRHFAVLHDACSLSRLLAISLEAFASDLRSSLLRAHTYFIIETRRDFCMLRFDFHCNSLRYPSAEDIFGRRFAYPTIVIILWGKSFFTDSPFEAPLKTLPPDKEKRVQRFYLSYLELVMPKLFRCFLPSQWLDLDSVRNQSTFSFPCCFLAAKNYDHFEASRYLHC